jgi:hypothetical protein
MQKSILTKKPESHTSSHFYTHIKPYSNNSAPQGLSSFASYKAKQDLTLLEYQLNQSESSSALKQKEEEIASLTLRIAHLERQLKEAPSSPNCRKCLFFEKDNKKLKESLLLAESSVDRLYKESKILNEQLSSLQGRLENLPEQSESNFSLKTHLKNLVFELELDLVQDLEEMDKKVRVCESHLERAAEKQRYLERNFENLSQNLENVENFSLQQVPEASDERSRQLEDYQQEIFRLGSMIVRFQEKYEALLNGNKEKVNLLRSENFKLKEELNLFLIKSEEKGKSITKIPVHLTGHGSVNSKLAGKKKLIEGHKQQVDFLNELHNEQLEKLHKELETLRYSYSQQEALLLKSQSSSKGQQENLNKALLSQMAEMKSLVSAQASQISHLSEENQRNRAEIKELSQSEISKKYTKLIIEFQTFQKIHEDAQNSLQKAEELNEQQEEIINSLKKGFYPHNSPKKLLKNDKSHEISLLKEMLDKKNLIIEDLKNQILISSQEHEKEKQQILACELSAQEEITELKNFIEKLENELENYQLKVDC